MSDLHFVLAMFFACMSCFLSLTVLFALLTRRRSPKGS